MIKTRIFELYYKRLKKPTILNGLVLHPFMSDNKITWELENPEDKSYYTYVIDGYLEELLLDFMDTIGVSYSDTGMTWGEITKKYCRLNKSDIHINQQLRQKINSSLENFNFISLSSWDGDLDSECFVKNWNIEYDSDQLYFELLLELNNPKINKEDVSYDQLSEFISEFYDDDESWDTQNSLLDVQLDIITDDKNLFDFEYMIYNGRIIFYDPFGIRLG